MSWLAGETKWWLVLAAVAGFALSLLFQLVKVQVRDRKAVAVAGSAAGAGAVGAARTSFGDAPSRDLPKPQVSTPDLRQPDLRQPDVRKPDLDPPGYAKPVADVGPDSGPDSGSVAPAAAGATVGAATAAAVEPGARQADVAEPEERTIIREQPPRGSFGAGSADPLPDGSAPSASYTIKGNADSMKFHPEDSPYYGRTVAEVWFDSEESARRAGFHRWDEKSRADGGVQGLVDPRPQESSFGAGTADPLPGGGSPHADFTIKGNADSMKFHPEDSPYYGRTVAEVWFDSEESARRAGFRHWKD